MRRVFISGSAHTYEPWSVAAGQRFIHDLAQRLAARGFTIVSGFGLGVGPFVLNGVLEQLQEERTMNLDSRIVLRPFPIAIEDPIQRTKRWTAYRKAMLSEAGVAIFVFGNKVDQSGNLVGADGMVEEFELAAGNGILVVPVGATGHSAKDLFDKVANNVQQYLHTRGVKARLSRIGSGGASARLAKNVVELVEQLRDAN